MGTKILQLIGTAKQQQSHHPQHGQRSDVPWPFNLDSSTRWPEAGNENARSRLSRDQILKIDSQTKPSDRQAAAANPCDVSIKSINQLNDMFNDQYYGTGQTYSH